MTDSFFGGLLPPIPLEPPDVTRTTGVVTVYAIVQQHELAGLTLATIMAGVLLVALGLARLSRRRPLRAVPRPTRGSTRP